ARRDQRACGLARDAGAHARAEMALTWRNAFTGLGRPRRRLGDIMASLILFLASSLSLMLTTAPLLFLFCLMQSATRANPGVDAYKAPPGTRVEPIAQSLETGDPPREFSLATNFARPEMAEDAQPQEARVFAKHDARPARRKQSGSGYRRNFSAHAYAQGR